MKTKEQLAKAAEVQRKYRLKHPDRIKNTDLKKSFGITLKDFNDLLLKQNSVCAICKQPETSIDYRSKKPYALSVDHCHDTGKIRGLLCKNCNTAIGSLQDSVDLLLEAIKYLTGA